MLGHIDLLVCGNSDPGTSGILSPFGPIKGFYFNDSKEPDNYKFEFKEDLSRIMKESNAEYVEIKCDNIDDYNKILDELVEFNKNCITVNGTSKDNMTIVLETDEKKQEENDIVNEIIDADE